SVEAMAIAVTMLPAQPASRLAAPSSCSMNSSARRSASEEISGASAALVWSVTPVPPRIVPRLVLVRFESPESVLRQAPQTSNPPHWRCSVRMNRTGQPGAKSVGIDAELGEIFQRAGVEWNGRLADALVLLLELIRLAMHRNPVGLLVEHRLHDVVGE